MVKKHVMKSLLGLIIAGIVNLSIVSTVLASDSEDNSNAYEGIVSSSHEVWSEPEFDGWKLEWREGHFYDILESIEKDGMIIQFDYDNAENRISKVVNGDLISYEYDDYGNLLYETSGSNSMEFVYSFDEKTERMLLSGFIYNGDEYSYVFDDNKSICSIKNDVGEEIARYVYDYGVCEDVLGIDTNGEWVSVVDEEFIGNINPYRYVRQYWDKETGWYWVGRYYAQEEGRFVDGIDEVTADELREKYGNSKEIFFKTYTVGTDINQPLKGRNAYSLPNVRYVAGVIFAESNVYLDDQQAVAWVIKQRMDATWGKFAEQSTAIEVVKADGQFTAPQYGTTGSAMWISALDMAVNLDVKKNPVETYPSGYKGQLYFNSVGTFQTNTKYQNGQFIYTSDGVSKSIWDITVVGYGSVDTEEKMNSIVIYKGKKNVFFSY